MESKWRNKLANLFLFIIVFSEFRFAIIYNSASSILFLIRDKNIALLIEYILFPTIIYGIYTLIKGDR